MNRMLSFCLAILLIVSCITPVRASEQETIIWYQETELDDGITVIDEVSVQSQTRSASKGYTRRKPFTTDDGIVIAIISIRGEFTYNGTTVSVASKEVTQTDTYEGWSYKQNSFTSSGGTITLDAKLTKLLVMNIPFTMTLTCDKDGNISYT